MQDIAALALAQVGIKADKVTNKTKFSDWAEARGGPPSGLDKDGDKVAWCATFVSWLWFMASEGATTICAGLPVGKGEVFDGGCSWIPTIIEWAEATGRWLEADEDPKPGDLIIFQLATKHIGIAVRFDSEELKVTCVEGNYSNGVHKTSYDAEDARILGFVRMS